MGDVCSSVDSAYFLLKIVLGRICPDPDSTAGHYARRRQGCKRRSLSEVLLFHSRKGKEVDSHCRTSDPEMEVPDTSSVSLWKHEKSRVK
jgi:hypothetical protein